MATKNYVVVSPLTYTGAETRGFTYDSGEQELPVGQIVKVPLGRRQSLGVVTQINLPKPEFATKPVSEVLDLPPLPAHITNLATWMQDYYYASAKSVWQTLLPAGITRKRRIKEVEPSPLTLKPSTEPLTAEQEAAIKVVETGQRPTTLIRGVTGAGKTRIYMELVATELAKGNSAIILVPEIALTPQLLALFHARFPNRILAYHSTLTESQKHVAWQRALLSEEPMVVVGARSGLFLPLARLGLVVIDECHETSYKQEQNPRYHAVTAAAQLARLAGAKLVLGSATPGVQEAYLASEGRLNLAELTKRVQNRSHPEIKVIDMRQAEVKQCGSQISRPLLQALTETLEAGRQSLLFINRRGSASSHQCDDCGYVSSCPTCHLPLTFHGDRTKLLCHICNYQLTPPAICPECSHASFKFLGGGTQRIEADIQRLLPKARLARLDKDSARGHDLAELHRQLHAGEIDILIGTQMIAKGLDLPALDTVGVINADTMLHMPDYSASERTYQLLTQVAGRAGRGDASGMVYIQTHSPTHPAVTATVNGDYWKFANAELAERQEHGYPPFRYLLKLTVSHQDKATASRRAQELYGKLGQVEQVRRLGPAPALYDRAGGQYHWHIIVKAASRPRLLAVAKLLPDWCKTDIDPINLL